MYCLQRTPIILLWPDGPDYCKGESRGWCTNLWWTAWQKSFCDFCARQDKNYTIFQFGHWPVHSRLRFDSIKMIFLIRGHSYMECDKNFGLLNNRSDVEIPFGLMACAANCSLKANPFYSHWMWSVHVYSVSD